MTIPDKNDGQRPQSGPPGPDAQDSSLVAMLIGGLVLIVLGMFFVVWLV